jgi:hypothetical protein
MTLTGKIEKERKGRGDIENVRIDIKRDIYKKKNRVKGPKNRALS